MLKEVFLGEIDHKLKIRIYDAERNRLDYVPNIISADPLDKLYIATEWLVTEALTDYNQTVAAVDENRKAHGALKENLTAMDDLAIRLGSRTQGYVNQLCLMEDMLVFEYDRMATILEKASAGKICFSSVDYEPLKVRFKEIRTFRRKVVAHTAYTYPRKEDNPETIVRSPLNLFPEPARITVGNNFFSGFSSWESQLPVISIFGWEGEMKPLFQDWKKLFTKKLLEVHAQAPLVNGPVSIESAYPHFVKEFSV